MRSAEFFVDPAPEQPSARHRARALNFNDQSIFSYAQPNRHWWGYA